MKSTKLAGLLLPYAIVGFAWITLLQSCFAHELNDSYNTTQSAIDELNVVALVPHRAVKSIPNTVEIFEFDNSPLAHRQPLLLIHGLLGEFHPFFRWKELAQFLSQNQAFQHRYKIYFARYNSHSPLKELIESFKQVLPKLAPDGGLTIVTISMSGAIVRDAMKDPAVEQCISRVLTLGALFRGSPLFCSDWMQQTIQKRHVSLLSKIDQLLTYKLYFARHKNLLLDYSWDNVDGQMPPTSPPHASADLDTSSTESRPAQFIAAAPQPCDHKFIVYAGYLHNQYIPKPYSCLHKIIATPFAYFSTTIPMHLGIEHPALRFLNKLVADAMPRTRDSGNILYPFNDGISPISSSLLLSDDFVVHTRFRNREALAKIQSYSYAKKSRLFDNIDHLSFIEGRRPSGSWLDVSDVLAQSEEPRPMFAWILKDLLE